MGSLSLLRFCGPVEDLPEVSYRFVRGSCDLHSAVNRQIIEILERNLVQYL